ncbi:zeta toxin family protein [Candidatus Berkiella aquae]|uniref:Zeta toxin family protein n=1 Tax=Candidatus Berkiella aquae TaxID=295108 RepID=A0A0Q9YPF7_9GAMM|nr:zeta toxin family protein [Candidatus Berkiella aquae]MCS5711954.1 zeta toxin family protein [Candidatus Berkiella aquae]
MIAEQFYQNQINKLKAALLSNNVALPNAVWLCDLMSKKMLMHANLLQTYKEKRTNGWKVDPINPVDYLKQIKSPNSIILIDTPHTLLQNSFYSFEYVGEICELVGNHRLMENTILSPERLALFYMTAFIVTEIQRDPKAKDEEKRPEDDLSEMVFNTFYPAVLKALDSSEYKLKIKMCNQDIDDYLKDTLDICVKYKMDLPLILSQLNDEKLIEYIKYCSNLQDRSRQNKCELGAMLKDVLPKALHTKIYNDLMNETVAKIVEEVGNQIIDENNYPRMALVAGKDRHTFMIVGAPACGKGSGVLKAANVVKQNGFEWRNVCKINTDDHRHIVSQGFKLGEDARNYAQLNNLEAMMISRIATKRYEQKVKNGEAPHLLLDTVLPTMGKFKLCLQNNAQMHLYVVSAPVDVSINRMMLRGQKTERYVSSTFLIESHKYVSADFIENIAKLSQEGENIDFVILDTDVPFGTDPLVVMCGDSRRKVIEVVDQQKVAYFYGKKNINTQGRSMKELYTDLDGNVINEFDDSYIEKLCLAGFKVDGVKAVSEDSVNLNANDDAQTLIFNTNVYSSNSKSTFLNVNKTLDNDDNDIIEVSTDYGEELCLKESTPRFD